MRHPISCCLWSHCMLFLLIQTLPHICCAGTVSHVSFLDLFGPIAGATNPITWHLYGKLAPRKSALQVPCIHQESHGIKYTVPLLNKIWSALLHHSDDELARWIGPNCFHHHYPSTYYQLHKFENHVSPLTVQPPPLKNKTVLEPQVSPAFTITYFCNHCNINLN